MYVYTIGKRHIAGKPSSMRDPRPKGGVLTTNKKAIVRGLTKLLPEEMEEKNCEGRKNWRDESNGSFVRWTHIAQDEKTWNWHIEK